MADNVIDTLSIQITSSSQGASRAIDKLCDNLTKLSGALNNYDRDSGKYGQALQGLEAGFESLNRSISRIDATNLNKVAKSLNMIANATDKLKCSFENVGLSKAQREAQALQGAVNKATEELMAMGGTSKTVAGQMSQNLEKVFKGAIWKNGALDDMSMEGSHAFDEIWRIMTQNAKKTAMDEIDQTNKAIVDYAGKAIAKVKLPFKLSDIDMGNEHGKNPRELLSSVFGVGGWTTSGTGDKTLKEYIEDFNQSTGSTIQADESVEAFNALANVVLKAKAGMEEFENATVEAKINMDHLWETIVQLATNYERFNAAIQTGMVQIKGDTPFSQLAESLQGLNGVQIPDLTGIANIATNIGQLANKKASAGIAMLPSLVQGLQSFSMIGAVAIPDLTGLAELCANIGKLANKKANEGVHNLPTLVAGLSQLQALSSMTFPDATPIANLAQSFAIMGRETSGRAVQNIPQLAQAFRQLMQTLSTAPKVSQNVIQLAEALAKLSANGSKVGSATRGLSSFFSKISSQSQSLSSRIIAFGKNLLQSGRHADTAGSKYRGLASTLGLLYAKYWLLIRVFSKFKGMIEVASSLTEVQNVVDTTFGNMSEKVEKFSHNAIKQFGISELAAKQTASRFQAMGVAMEISGGQVQKAQQFLNTRKTMEGNAVGYNKASNSMADMSINLTKLSADMASFYDVEQDTVQKALASGVFGGQTRPLRTYGLDLTNATLQEWAMKNGLDANIKSMTQAQKTLLRYQYVMANTSKVQGKQMVA